ncbi:hypothetical protein D9M69_549940 [compost metagenome]
MHTRESKLRISQHKHCHAALPTTSEADPGVDEPERLNQSVHGTNTDRNGRLISFVLNMVKGAANQ